MLDVFLSTLKVMIDKAGRWKNRGRAKYKHVVNHFIFRTNRYVGDHLWFEVL